MVTIDENHKYWEGKLSVPGFTEIATAVGIIKPSPFYTEAGRDEGKALHAWFLFLAQGQEPEEAPDDRIAGRVEGIRKFLRESGFKLEGGETPQGSLALGYATTPDLWGQLAGARSVIDAKRGAEVSWHPLQTAAQRIALAHAGVHCLNRYALYLRDGDYRLEPHRDRLDEKRWREVVNGYYAAKFYQEAS